MAFLLCAATLPAFAANSVVKTEYFDVIYPPESAETASLIAAYADGLADAVCADLGTSMRERVPVYLTSRQKDLNAYFTPYAYNRIVIYDALPVDGALSGFRDPILSVFYHELVHLVTLNIRTPFWRVMSDIFGDFLTVNELTMPLSFLEGATVSFESRNGDGRLNDPLPLHTLRQAKIEGKFLSFKESAGARDVYPSGRVSYYYGGAFSAWLQQTYGMAKYAELWRRGGGFNPFLSWTWTRFAQVYGVPLDTAWGAFRDSVELPKNIVEAGTAVYGAKAGVLANLAACPLGIAWSDANAGRVFFRSNEGDIGPLFDSDGNVTRLSLSDDGSLLLVSSYSVGDDFSAETVRVYDLERRKFTGERYSGFRDASFAGSNDRVCAVRTSGQRSELVVFSRAPQSSTDRSAIASSTLAEAGPGLRWSAVYSPSYAGGRQIAFIGSNGPTRDIALVNENSGELSALSFPIDLGYARYLQSTKTDNGRVLSFGWATKGDLYRWGFYRCDDGEVNLSVANASGGAFYPVIDSPGRGTFYISAHSDHDELRYEPFAGATSASGFADSSPLDGFLGNPASKPYPAAPYSSRGYFPLRWFRDGVFLPFFDSLPLSDGRTVYGPQVNYITEDPTETLSVTASASYFNAARFAAVSLDTVFRSELASIELSGADTVQPAIGIVSPYRETSGRLDIAHNWYLDESWKCFSAVATGFTRAYAPEIDDFVYGQPFDALSVGGGGELAFSAVKRRVVRSRPFFPVTQTGYFVAANGYRFLVRPVDVMTGIAQGQAVAYFPVIPLSIGVVVAVSDRLLFAPNATVYDASIAREYAWDLNRYYPAFPEYDDTDYASAMSHGMIGGTAILTPIHIDIQRGLPIFPVYANRFVLETGYRWGIFGLNGEERARWLDTATITGRFEASVVIGALTNVLLYGQAEYAIPLRAGVPLVSFSVGGKIPL